MSCPTYGSSRRVPFDGSLTSGACALSACEEDRRPSATAVHQRSLGASGAFLSAHFSVGPYPSSVHITPSPPLPLAFCFFLRYIVFFVVMEQFVLELIEPLRTFFKESRMLLRKCDKPTNAGACVCLFGTYRTIVLML